MSVYDIDPDTGLFRDKPELPVLEPTDTCRWCGKGIRLEQRHWASTAPLDGSPWYCAADPGDEKRHQPACCQRCDADQ